MSKTEMTSQVEWKTLNWAKVDWVVFKLQKRIYRASERGEITKRLLVAISKDGIHVLRSRVRLTSHARF